MKKNLLVLLLMLQVVVLVAQTNTTSKISASQSKNTDLWVNPEGMENNMTIYATVYKDGQVFEPAGLLLGVFKGTDTFCYGYDTWLEMDDKTKIHMVLAMSNESSATGYNFKAFNPATNETFEIAETFTFVADGEFGAFNSPVKLNITGSSSINRVFSDRFNIYPNPVKDRFTVVFSNTNLEKVSVELLSSGGKVLKQHTVNNSSTNQASITLQREGLSSGVYFLKLSIGNSIQYKKLILK